MEDFYNILGIKKDSTKDEIKKAYRTLSFQYHPDRNKSEEAHSKIQKINEAYEVLGDESKRKMYDIEQNGMDFHQFFGGNMNPHMGNFDNIINNLFGGLSGGLNGGAEFQMGENGPKVHIFHGGLGGGLGGFGEEIFENLQKPTTINKDIHISLAQSYFGGNVILEIEKWNMVNNMKLHETEKIEFNVPAGVYDDETITLKNMGNFNGRTKGDIKICVHIDDEDDFYKEGNDLVYVKKLSLKEALCGFEFNMKHINGQLYSFSNTNNVVIHPKFKKYIPELGFQRNDTKGNLVIKFELEFPETLDSEIQKKLLEIL